MKLIDAMPEEFARYHTDERAHRYADVEVVSEYRFGWPGPQKNVHYWVELENGYAVGWNENPSRGWSFPVVRVKVK